MGYQQNVAAAFDLAKNYHQQASVQERVAQQLALLVAEFDLPEKPRILEIGCGTGFLSQHLIKQWPHANLLLTDISPGMLERCQTQLGEIDRKRVDFARMDGESISLEGEFDLIISSLAFQWFNDPMGNLEKLALKLASGGRLAFMTLGDGSFHEWRKLCEQSKIPCGLHQYPNRAAWEKAWPVMGSGEMVESRIIVDHPSPQFFLKGLKQIGASLSPADYRPITGAGLRQVLRSHNRMKKKFSITYHLLFGSFKLDNEL
jgi:malonyl-CoA O-methyltransferase